MNNYCVKHPDRQAVGKCSKCGKSVCMLCAQSHFGKIYCFDCVEFAQDFRPDWEKPYKLGYLKAFFNTWKKIVTQSDEFFSQLTPAGGFFYPVVFATIINTVALWGYLALGYFFYPAQMQSLLMHGSHAIRVIAVFVPFFMVLDVFTRSFILHIFVFICGGRRGLVATLRVVGYSAAVQIFLIVPYLGPAIAGIWRLVLTILGISRLHKISGARATLAVLFPIMIAIVLIVILFILGRQELLKILSRGCFPKII